MADPSSGISDGWQHKAACRGVNTELFFVEPVRGAKRETAERKRINLLRDTYCGPCPVRQQCLDDAILLKDLRYAVRGGITPYESGAYSPLGQQTARGEDAKAGYERAWQEFLGGKSFIDPSPGLRAALKGRKEAIMTGEPTAMWRNVTHANKTKVSKGRGWVASTTADGGVVLVLFRRNDNNVGRRFFKRQHVVYTGNPPAVLEEYPDHLDL